MLAIYFIFMTSPHSPPYLTRPYIEMLLEDSTVDLFLVLLENLSSSFSIYTAEQCGMRILEFSEIFLLILSSTASKEDYCFCVRKKKDFPRRCSNIQAQFSQTFSISRK